MTELDELLLVLAGLFDSPGGPHANLAGVGFRFPTPARGFYGLLLDRLVAGVIAWPAAMISVVGQGRDYRGIDRE